jgi:ribosomal protein L12E/L44/L45/RPP1/RPP2
MGMGFGISDDDIIAVALNRGVIFDDTRASALFRDLDHDSIEDAALQADDMDEQTTLAFAEIDRQLDEMGCWDEKKAELAAQSLDEQTPKAPATRQRRV